MFKRIGKSSLFFERLFAWYLVPEKWMSEFPYPRDNSKLRIRIEEIRSLFGVDFPRVLSRLFELASTDIVLKKDFYVVTRFVEDDELKIALLLSKKVPHDMNMYQFFSQQRKSLLKNYEVTLKK